MIRQRNGNMRRRFRSALESAQTWADFGGDPVSVIRAPGGYNFVFAGEEFFESPSTYIAMTVHPRRGGDA